ncbi:MAG: NUDIX hydrolase [Verrucomicrobiota bacterium]
MPTPPENPWTTHKSETKYDNPWLTIVENQVTNPSGGEGIYGVVHFKRTAVGIIPIDDEGNTWLVGQYRYPTNTYEWEIPEGGADPGEDTLSAGKRELLEETGITAQNWEPILELQLSNSTTNEVAVSYIARDLSFGDAQPETTEKLELKKLPLAEACAMAADGRIKDAIAVATLLKTAHLLGIPADVEGSTHRKSTPQ